MLSGCSVVELMVIAFTGLVIFTVLFGTLAVVIIEVLHPETDTSEAIDGLSRIIGTILGALLGLLAGKSEAISQTHDRQ